MNSDTPLILKRMLMVSIVLAAALLATMFLGLSMGSSGNSFKAVWVSLFGNAEDSVLSTIIWRLRMPRVIMAALVGATLSVGGLVFQALLRNPLAEPYILGISGGSAIGAGTI